MDVLTQNHLTHNAYRILGLGADASQEAIDQAARRMRLWANAQRIPGTSWDLPWLGALQRTRSNIEQAVARLADPSSRLRERMTWFCGPSETFAADLSTLRSNLQQAEGQSAVQREHNAAVADLAAAMLQPSPADPGNWQAALQRFQNLSDSQEQLRWQLELESIGGFEKRASESEILQINQSMPRQIADSLSRYVESALEEDNADQASAFLITLRSAGGKSDQRLLDRLEEVFERRCHNIADDLRAGVRGDHTPQQNALAARAARKAFEGSIVPLRRDLEKLAADQTERIKRIRWHCARVLSMIATAWMYSRQFIKAEDVLNQALSLAQNSTQEDEIRGQLIENEPRAQEQRRQQSMVANAATGYSIDVSSRGNFQPATPGTLNYEPASATRDVYPMPQPVRVQPKRQSSASRWAMVILGVLLVRIFSMMGTSGPSYPTPNPPTYNFPAPRYIPPPPQNTNSPDDVLNRILEKNPIQDYSTTPREPSPIYRDVPTTRTPQGPFNFGPYPQPASPSQQPLSPSTPSINPDNAGLSREPRSTNRP